MDAIANPSKGPLPLIFLSIVFVLAGLLAGAQPSIALAQESWRRQDVLVYLRNTYAGISGANNLAMEALDEPSPVPGLTWFDAFAFLAAADRVGESLEKGNYARAAQDSATFVVAFEAARRSSAISTLSSAVSIAGLAHVFIDMGLNNIAEVVADAAVDAQIKRYVDARSGPLNRTHEFIMRGVSDDEILFTTSPRGWFAVVGEHRTRLVPPHGYTREQIFASAKAIYDARAAAGRLTDERLRIEQAFHSLLLERAPDGPPSLVGSWSGIYHCSDRGDATGRIEWAIRETDTGALFVEENSYRNGRHEFETYALERDPAREAYVGRSAKYRLEFRVQRVRHLISLEGAYVDYTPCATFLLSPATETRSVEEPVPPSGQPLAGDWEGIFHCEDRGSDTGTTKWRITYDESGNGTFHIDEERERDGRNKKVKYRGQFDVEEGYFKASHFAWHVLFRVDDSLSSLRGIYWPDTGRMFERCKVFELSRGG